MTTWVDEVDPGTGNTGYGLDHLPLGSMVGPRGQPRVVTRIGHQVLDLTLATTATEFEGLFAAGTLDALLAAGPRRWAEVRDALTTWLGDPQYRAELEPLLTPLDRVALRLPFTVADYVDFYASEQHAATVGALLRPGSPPLPRAWRHLPIGYHGRAGSVFVSDADVVRPSGQFPDADGSVRFAPTERLDFEAEVGFVVGVASAPGTSIPVSSVADHVFGVVLVNDWSARDVQAFEYVPLGPFLGKSFATSVSAWVTPLAALAAAWTAPPPRDPPAPAYLDDAGVAGALDISIEIRLNGALIGRTGAAALYWTPAQMLAHLTANGAPARTGDLFASGTVSGPDPGQHGCLLELTANGTRPLDLPDGGERTWLLDGDLVELSATAPGTSGGIVRLGEVRGRIRPGGTNRGGDDE